MINNDVLRRLRYTFDLSDHKVVSIFALVGIVIDQKTVTSWLKRDEDESFLECQDIHLAQFLNGFICEKRGKKEGVEILHEKRLTNNIILKKIAIALNLKSEDILAIMEIAQMPMSKHELSAFFRKVDHPNYRECKDQVLRNFLKGLQMKYRDSQK